MGCAVLGRDRLAIGPIDDSHYAAVDLTASIATDWASQVPANSTVLALVHVTVLHVLVYLHMHPFM